MALDLDGVLGDTRPLWDDWLAASSDVLEIAPTELPPDRGEAAARLDAGGAGNWRALLERYAEERVAVYLRRDAPTSDALRLLAECGRALGVFTDAPEPLARVVLRHLGADRLVSAVETGSGALERLIARLGDGALVARTRAELRTAVDEAL